MSNQVNITPEALATSANKFRKDLLMMPVIALQSSLDHMTLRMGVRGDETVGELSSDIEIGPYSETRTDTSDSSIKGRILTTYRGSVIKKFSPNSVADSIYGSTVLSGDGLKNTDITTAVVAYLVKKVSKALNSNLFKAVRDADGDTTFALFNGFDTIAANEITASKITKAIGNLYEFTEPITSTNAVDQLKAFFRASKDELQGETAKLFMPKDIYNAYVDDYQASHGSVPYNTTFKKTYLEGSDDSCELVALPNKKGQPYIQLTTKGNMLVGVDQMSQTETISVEKLDALVLTLVMVMYFGVQYESISPERLLIGKLFVPAP